MTQNCRSLDYLCGWLIVNVLRKLSVKICCFFCPNPGLRQKIQPKEMSEMVSVEVMI